MLTIGDSHRKSIVKTLSWRILGTIITCIVAFIVTGEVRLAAGIGLIDTLVKLGIFIFMSVYGTVFLVK